MNAKPVERFKSRCFQCRYEMEIPLSFHRKDIRCASCGHQYLALRIGENTFEGRTFLRPKVIGFWHPEGRDPRMLVTENGYGSELPAILHYLRAAPSVAHMMGFSFCRFECGTPDHEMGSCDLSDGEWVWPQGLAHYVEEHSVRLPDEFIATMRDNRWEPPTTPFELYPFGARYDPHFWESWCARQAGGEAVSLGEETRTESPSEQSAKYLVEVEHPHGRLRLPLEEWIRFGQGSSMPIRLVAAYEMKSGEEVSLSVVPLRYRNSRWSRLLVLLGMIPAP
jgi:hypothetical protein